ncbi:hypothetical protein K3495_g12471 [Podosphaera aphanis]|nr:hypothetical protein K3495_g12471 [Podosphaera aphanis]
MSAKQTFDTIATTREEGAAMPYETAVRNLLNTNFTTIEEYCNTFMQHYLSVNSAAESMVSHEFEKESTNPFIVPHGLASFLFVLGTEGVEWLETWRQTKVLDRKNGYTSLENLMSTLRQVGKSSSKFSGHALVATGSRGQSDQRERTTAIGRPDDHCVLCEHHHKNKNCFKQHPELIKSSKQKGKRNSKGKGKGKSRGKQSCTVSKVFFDSDKESINDIDTGNSKVARISPASLHKNPLLYDTGASHHFVCSKHDFLTLAKLRKPFKFDQAIGTSVLTHQGTSCVRIGNEILELKESLYSPNSTCTIISAGRLKEQHGIVAVSANELLVKMENNQPVARLVAIENVLFIKPLRERERATFSSNIVAPGVARLRGCLK